MYICVSYNTGTRALPGIYTAMLKGAQHLRASAYLSGKAQVPVL